MSSRLTRIAAGLGLALLLAGPLEAAGLHWEVYRRPAPTPRLESAMVYDSVRQRFLLFGGYEGNFGRDGEIWEYEPVSASWTEVTPTKGERPEARNGAVMAYDPLRQRVILFGGQLVTGGLLSDTWEWDCVAKTWTWLLVEGPSWRSGSSLVHDGGADRLLLFGGAYQRDTWAFDLAARTWTLLPTTFSSPNGAMRPRSYHAAAVNPATQRLVIFGGIDGSQFGVADDLDDMWELRGSVWTEVTPPVRPPAGGWRAMAFDELGRLVLHGGWTNAGAHSYADTWVTVWNGSAWASWQRAALPPAPSPGIRDSHVMVTDTLRHRILLFGGYLTDLWEFAAGAWAPAAPRWDPGQSQEVYAPAKQSDHAMAYDSLRNQVQMFGAGSIEMWRFDLSTHLWFIERNQAPMPITRANHAMVYDAAHDRTILFGGACKRDPWSVWSRECPEDGSYLPPETWAWNAADRSWTDVSPAVSPSPRHSHGMAYDAAHGQVVVFGGRGDSGTLDDTWLWNGSVWSQAATPVKPSARFGHAMAYDPVRARVVLFGGTGLGSQDDTWEWDGTQWLEIPVSGPKPTSRVRASFVSAGDGQAGLLLLGGVTSLNDEWGGPALTDGWLWSGSAWHGIAQHGSVPHPRQASAVVATASGKLVLYGGRELRDLPLATEVWFGQIERGTASAAATDCSAVEGSPPGTCRVALDLDPPATQPVTIGLTPVDDLARLGFDYGPLPPAVTFPIGAASRTLDVPVLDDALYEGIESFFLDLAGPAGVTLMRTRVTGDIVDDDPKPVLTIAPCSVVEGNGFTTPLNVELTLTGATERAISVQTFTSNALQGGSAISGLDHAGANTDLLFPAGSGPRTLPFQIPVYGDREVEVTETLRVRAAGVHLASGVTHECTVVDDDLHAWKVAGIGAFDGNGSPDLLWRHDLTGELRVWLMNGLQRVDDRPLRPAANTAFGERPQALADLDGNGTSDLLWQDYLHVSAASWLMNGTNRLQRKSLSNLSGKRLEAAADFGPAPSGGAPDGHPDLVWRDRESGETVLHFLSGPQVPGGKAIVERHPRPEWQLAGAADLGSRTGPPDSRPDLLWRQPVTGRLVVWIMEGPYRKRGFFTTPTAEPDLDWRAVGLADFDHDGKNDILWQNDATHALRVWLMDGGTRLAELPLDPATGP